MFAISAGGVGTSVGSAIASEPTVKIRCGECRYEEKPDEFGNSKGCQEWCLTCGERSSSNNKYCLALCSDCEQEWRNTGHTKKYMTVKGINEHFLIIN